jgi:phosphoribosylformylglycinamidine cyclo-ligase
MAGFCVGVVERDHIVNGRAIQPGDAVLGLASTGLHSNGYGLARKVVFDHAGLKAGDFVPELGRTVGEELLEPTRIYAKDCLALAAEAGVRTFAHVTGGGLVQNLARVIPAGLTAVLDRGSWTPAPVFRMIAQRGRVEAEEMERTFNMGIGMVAVVTAEDVDRALAVLTARHVPAWVLGEVAKQPNVEGTGEQDRVVLRGNHPRF